MYPSSVRLAPITVMYLINRANALVNDIENARLHGNFYGEYRGSAEQLLNVELDISKMVYVWLAFLAADGSRQSDSVIWESLSFKCKYYIMHHLKLR